MPNVVGAIDCTHVPIAAPWKHAEQYVNGNGNLQYKYTSCGKPQRGYDSLVCNVAWLCARLKDFTRKLSARCPK